MESTQNLSENSFDFASLPYVCQRRFAEICDGRTLRTFASINDSTRNLSKRCHWIKNFIVDYFDPNYSSLYAHVQCYCTDKEYCKLDYEGFDFCGKGKFEALNDIEIIQFEVHTTLDASFFQQLPIRFTSNKSLRISVESIKFSVLKDLINQNLKKLYTSGEIIMDNSFYEFIEFFKSLSNLDKYESVFLPQFSPYKKKQKFLDSTLITIVLLTTMSVSITFCIPHITNFLIASVSKETEFNLKKILYFNHHLIN